MFTAADIFPDGRTGYDLTPNQSAEVRAYYRKLRRGYYATSRDEARYMATSMARRFDPTYQ